eukprot:TRINITY_DN7699_c0_g1_i1.p1 TRINITY_DN7699_c0_g1~~TRINITY_DN7699_c0_g1_i1.p1  ORF type:complete len:651 (+),score=233.11 TRINITY_DN7699_c0_g1_i1:139-2091(+)
MLEEHTLQFFDCYGAAFSPMAVDRLANSLKFLASQCIETSRYGAMSQCLAKQWTGNQCLSAAVRLLKKHGVEVSAEEVQSLQHCSEREVVEALVSKMPSDSREFEMFFLQLRMIVAVASSVREGLEAGSPEAIKGALEQAADNLVSDLVLPICVVQAGSELINLKDMQAVFVKDAENRMSKLMRGQIDAMQAKKDLAAAQAKLEQKQHKMAAAKSTAVKYLSQLMGGDSSAMLKTILHEWAEAAHQLHEERMIWEEYAPRIEEAQTSLMRLKTHRVRNVANLFDRKSMRLTEDLVIDAFLQWRDQSTLSRLMTSQAQMKEMGTKMNNYKDTRKAKARAVMARMFGQEDGVLLALVWKAWWSDFSGEKDMKEKALAEEKARQEYKQILQDKRAKARVVLLATAEGQMETVLQMVMQTWRDACLEAKVDSELQQERAAMKSLLDDHKKRNKASAKAALDKAAAADEEAIKLKMFHAWRLDSRLETLFSKNSNKIEGKRQQLFQVQHMFRTFASNLEDSLHQNVAESTRDVAEAMRRPQVMKRRSLSASKSTPTLPEITETSRPGTPTMQPSKGSSAAAAAAADGRDGRRSDNGRREKERGSKGALEDGWESAVDPKSGRTYYMNRATGQTTWEKPEKGGGSRRAPAGQQAWP